MEFYFFKSAKLLQHYKLRNTRNIVKPYHLESIQPVNRDNVTCTANLKYPIQGI